LVKIPKKIRLRCRFLKKKFAKVTELSEKILTATPKPEKKCEIKEAGDASLAGTLPVTDGKYLQNRPTSPSGYPCFPHTKRMEGDPRYFQKKTGQFFPVRNPLYFSTVLPLQTCPKSRKTC